MIELPGLRQSTAWLALAAGLAFAVPAVFSMGLRWERSQFLVPYVGIIGTQLLVYFRRHPVSLKQLTGHWPFALVGIAAASFELLINRKTARTLGLKVPQELLIQADEVID